MRLIGIGKSESPWEGKIELSFYASNITVPGVPLVYSFPLFLYISAWKDKLYIYLINCNLIPVTPFNFKMNKWKDRRKAIQWIIRTSNVWEINIILILSSTKHFSSSGFTSSLYDGLRMSNSKEYVARFIGLYENNGAVLCVGIYFGNYLWFDTQSHGILLTADINRDYNIFLIC